MVERRLGGRCLPCQAEAAAERGFVLPSAAQGEGHLAVRFGDNRHSGIVIRIEGEEVTGRCIEVFAARGREGWAILYEEPFSYCRRCWKALAVELVRGDVEIVEPLGAGVRHAKAGGHRGGSGAR